MYKYCVSWKCRQTIRRIAINTREILKKRDLPLAENLRSIGCLPVLFSKIIAVHKTNLITAYAHKK